MDTKHIFEAESQDIQGLFTSGSPSPYYYVPAYQRNFSWEKSELVKLFADICHGYSLLQKSKENATFIGSIILIKANKQKYKESVVGNKGPIPEKLFAIIDGQQRLTSLLLLLSVLHERLMSLYSGYKFSDDDSCQFLRRQVIKTLNDLTDIFLKKQAEANTGTATDYYPRLTREKIDAWDINDPIYDSSIASHLSKYGKIATVSYDFLTKGLDKAPEKDEETDQLWWFLKKSKIGKRVKWFYKIEESEGNEKFVNALAVFRKLVNKFCDLTLDAGRDEDTDEGLSEVPTIDRVFEINPWQHYRALLSDDLTEELDQLRGFIKREEEKLEKDNQPPLSDESKKGFLLLTQLTLLTRFVLNNVVVTKITAQTEDYAFDIFESLNTTGAPLTAIETFKPQVLLLKDSTSHEYIQTIDAELNKKTEGKRTNTENLLITFSLEEKGEKISSRLNAQRAFLKVFDRFDDEKKKSLFVKALFNSYSFIREAWQPEIRSGDEDPIPHSKQLVNLDDETQFCLDFLCKLNHSIVQPVLIRYYSEALLDKKKKSDFEEIVKACSAYSLLRRAASGGTNNIEQEYRKLLNGNGEKTKQICRLDAKNNENSLPSVDEVKQYLRDFLIEKGIDTREKWVEKVVNIPHYTASKVIARFLLIAAFDLDAFDSDFPSVEMEKAKKPNGFMKKDTWKDDLVQTLEHIVPQNRGEWNNPKYDCFYSGSNKNKDNPLMHGIGNLVLCPEAVNKSFGNKEWPIKRKAYEICALSSEGKAEELKKHYVNEFSEISLDKYKTTYAPTLRHLAYLDEKDLTDDFIKARGIQIAELAWNRVAPWLDLQPEKPTRMTK